MNPVFDFERFIHQKCETKVYEKDNLIHWFVIKVHKDGECFIYDKITKKEYSDEKYRYFYNVLTGKVEIKVKEEE